MAAPTTSIDLSTPSGDSIKIEERASHELTTIRGPVVSKTLDAEYAERSPVEEPFPTRQSRFPGSRPWLAVLLVEVATAGR